LEQRERLFEILKILAHAHHGALTLTALMKKTGYSKLRDFRRDLHDLERLGLVELQRSGFPSDSDMHRKIAVLTADVITVHSEKETEEYLATDESVEIRLSPSYTPNELHDLVKIRSPLGTISYMNRKDFNELKAHKTDILGLPDEEPIEEVKG